MAGRIVVGSLAALAVLLAVTALIVGAVLALRFGAPSWVVAFGGIAVLVAAYLALQKAAARNG